MKTAQKTIIRLAAVPLFLLALFACKPEVKFLFAPQAQSDVAYTNNNKIVFKWNRVSNAQYYLYRVDEGKWIKTDKLSVSITLPEGDAVHKLFIKAVCEVEKQKNKTKVESKIASFQVVVDQTPPKAPVFNPQPGVDSEGNLIPEEFNHSAPQWKWSAQAADFIAYTLTSDSAELPVTSEETVVDGKVMQFLLPAELSEAINTLSQQEPPVKQFNFTLAVKAGDLAGNWSETVRKPILVDLSAFAKPTVVNANPTPDPDNLGIADRTNNKRPSWKWTDPSPDPQNNPSQKFRYQLDTLEESFWVEGDSKLLSFTPDYDLTDGPHTLHVQALNTLSGGGVGQWSATGSCTLVVDTEGPKPPTVTAAASVTNTQPVWSWQVAEPSDVQSFFWKVDENSPQTLAATENTFEYTSESLVAPFPLEGAASDGEHTFSVKTVDALGNESAFVSCTVVINTQGDAAPVISLIGGLTTPLGEVVTQNALSVFRFEVADIQAVQQAWFALDAANPQAPGESEWVALTSGELKNQKIAFDNKGSHPRLSEGTHTLSMKTENLQGNDSAVGTFTMKVDLTGPNAVPADSIMGKGVTGNRRPTWSWPPVADAVQYKCALGDPASPNLAWFFIDEPSFSVAGDLEAADTPEGKPYQFTVVAIDLVGNSSPATTVTTGISSKVPKAPTVTLQGETPTNQLKPKWTWTVPEGESAVSVSYQLVQGTTVVADFPDQATTVLSFQPTGDLGQAGQALKYDFKIFLKNDLGIASATVVSSVVIDLQGPDAAQFADSSSDFNITGKIPSSKKLTYKFRHADPSDVAQWVITFNGEETLLTAADFSPIVQLSSNGKWNYSKEGALFVLSVPQDAELNSGVQTFQVVAKDRFGNASAAAEWNETQIDNSSLKAPVLTLVKDPSVWLKDVTQTVGGVPVTVSLMKTEQPVINWTPGEGETVSQVKAVRYRANQGSWQQADFAAGGPYTVEPGKVYPIGQGLKRYDVSLKNEVGNWSPVSTLFLSVDSIPPLPPLVSSKGIDRSGSNRTSDTTPTWTIAYQGNSSEIAKVEVAVTQGTVEPSAGDWKALTFTSELPDFYVSPTTLSAGDWTLNVRVADIADNVSTVTKCTLTIDPAATNWGSPDAVTGVSASKGGYTHAIKVVWDEDPEATAYIIFRMTRAEYAGGERKGTQIASVGTETEYFDTTAALGGEYYYRVRADNEAQGPVPTGFDAPSAYGFRLAQPQGVAVERQGSQNRFKLKWTPTDANSDVVYTFFRIGPFNGALTEAEINAKPITEWNYLPKNSTQWVSCPANLSLTEVNAVGENGGSNFDDPNEVEPLTFYYYQVVAFSKTNVAATSENTHAEPVLAAGYILDLDLSNWLTASDLLKPNNYKDKAYGKVKLTMTVPQADRSKIADLQVSVRRTYRYGGGYQGHLATTQNKINHTDLMHPNPKLGPWERTITLEYPFPVSELANGSVTVYDTMYDVDDSGNKLIAALDTARDLGGDWKPCYGWYERTASFMSGAGQSWERIHDPDGSDSEMEFHYLIWDWLLRKAMNHPGNPNQNSNKFARVDIKSMISGDYQVVVKHKNPMVTTELVGPVKRGTPALNAREFGFLVMIMREISFYRIKISFSDEIDEAGVGMAGEASAAEHRNAAISGTLHKENGGLDGLSGAKADVYTNPSMEEFPGVKMSLNWAPMKIMFGGPNQCMFKDQHQINLETPVASGRVGMDVWMYGGIFYHGVGNGTNFYMNYAAFNDLNQPSSHWQAQATGKMPLEYLNDGFTWKRAGGNNNKEYYDRYTSINWVYNGKAYPGF